MIVKIKNKWILFNKDGTKRLGVYDTKEEAEKREKQILYFKRKNALKDK